MPEKQINTRIVHKHDLEVNWLKATNFVPKKGELIIYDVEVDENGNTLALPDGRTEPYRFERFKIGDGVVQPDGTIKGTKVTALPFTVNPHTHEEKANIADLKITGTVTTALGGIAKDKTYSNADITEVLSDLLFPYVAPTLNSIVLSEAAGTFEYGTVRTVSKVTPNFTKGSKAITSIKIGTTSGGSDLYSGDTTTSGVAITLTNSKTYDGNSGGTIYCTISDGQQSTSKSATISYAYYNYTAVTSSTTAPTTASVATNRGTSAEATITTTDNTYIWFLMPNQNKKQIQQYAMNQWNNMATTYAGTVNFTTSTGKQVTYYAYRTDAMTAASEKYRIN